MAGGWHPDIPRHLANRPGAVALPAHWPRTATRKAERGRAAGISSLSKQLLPSGQTYQVDDVGYIELFHQPGLVSADCLFTKQHAFCNLLVSLALTYLEQHAQLAGRES
ncbi:hypothetical protein D3C80_1084830 [compost metagenome]